MEYMKKTRPQVVVVGGGFAGIEAVRSLQKKHVRCDITLVSKSDTFEYYPALYKLVTGALAIEASVPLRDIHGFSRIKLVKGTFSSVDNARQVIVLEDKQEVAYDYLVLALGSETNYFNIPGLPDLSYSFKSVKEAFRLKKHFCEVMGVALDLPRDEAVAKLHTVVVGGGPSGVELAGDLMHYLRELASVSGVESSYVTVDLIESGPRILPMMSEKVSRIAEARLRKMKVNIYTNRAVTSQDISEVTMGNMNFNTNTVIWTAGTRINTAYHGVPNVTFSDRGRVIVDQYFALPSDNRIFVIGDGAATPYSGLAQTAIHDGAYIGRHIARIIRGTLTAPYNPRKVSFVIPIGSLWAMFIFRSLVFRGIIPWLLRTFVDLKYLMSIVPIGHVIRVIQKGHIYRHSKTYCPVE